MAKKGTSKSNAKREPAPRPRPGGNTTDGAVVPVLARERGAADDVVAAGAGGGGGGGRGGGGNTGNGNVVVVFASTPTAGRPLESQDRGDLDVVFCDIGDVLGDPVFSPPPDHLERLDVFPFVAEALKDLAEQGFRLGIISNTGDLSKKAIDLVLAKAGLLEFFEPELLIYSSVVGLTKKTPEIFRLAAEKAKGSAAAGRGHVCLFVGEDPRERSVAARAGFRVARDLTILSANIARFASFTTPAVPNLAACIEDARLAALDAEPGPAEPNDFHQLLGRLEAARTTLPPSYRERVWVPYTETLRGLGPIGFANVLSKDPDRESTGGLMMDIAHAILQNGEKFQAVATDAFEEVVTDLYDGFLSAQDRKGIKVPDEVVLPPLVKWGNPEFGPYTWPIDATSGPFDVGAAVVSLPPANARGGLLAWAALSHETGGHDILHADDGLAPELAIAVQKALEAERVGFGLAEYWSARIDETASDVLGILNMGPAAAIGLIGYFRGLSAASSGVPRLRSTGPLSDPHPADILRGYLAAATVRLLSFTGASEWSNLIDAETDRDLATIRVGGLIVSPTVARQSAEIVAGVIATHKTQSLNRHALIEIQDWRDRDEDIVAQLRSALRTTALPPQEIAGGVFAAHVVAAAVTEALQQPATLSVVFARMVAILKLMHDKNPAWGPLFVTQPSTIRRDRVFMVHRPPVVASPISIAS